MKDRIIPAILPKSQEDLVGKVECVLGACDMIQVDVCDGIFVPSKTEFTELPFRDQMNYELDLMVMHPEKELEKWVGFGAQRIIFHIESLQDPMKAFQSLRSLSPDIKIGLSFDDEYDLSKIDPYISSIDFLQVMGIDHAGKQGESFSERSLSNIEALRAKYPELVISVDGAVNQESLPKLLASGSDRFAVGSAIWNSPDPKQTLVELEGMVK